MRNEHTNIKLSGDVYAVKVTNSSLDGSCFSDVEIEFFPGVVAAA